VKGPAPARRSRSSAAPEPPAPKAAPSRPPPAPGGWWRAGDERGRPRSIPPSSTLHASCAGQITST